MSFTGDENIRENENFAHDKTACHSPECGRFGVLSVQFTTITRAARPGAVVL
jgi:hypothetical protein